MLWNASSINGYAILASDGTIGTVSDVLFDDTSWLVRWLVVDTGHWLSGRKVLLPSSAMAGLDAERKECTIRLTMQQIEDSPSIASDQPVSRQMETTVYDYYGYSPYWNSGFGYLGSMGYLGGFAYRGGLGGAMPIATEGERTRDELAKSPHANDDVHLRSAAAVVGYHIHATDGEIGHIKAFLLEDSDWSIRYLVVDTSNWWMGRDVLISPLSVRHIDWSDLLVHIDVDRQKVKDGPEYDLAMPIDHGFDDRLMRHYGIELAGGGG
jgi:sporulation protein YlmC with PRC-barrel domain